MQECNTELAIHAEKTAEALVNKLKALSFKLALCESCTAGLISNLIARIPGASSVLWGSYVCYTREAKISMLDLDKSGLAAHGLVSGETASSMATMALQKSLTACDANGQVNGAEIAAAVTGLAGPEGDGSGVPVGTVWVAAARRGEETAAAREFHFDGERNEVRLKAAIAVLETVQSILPGA
jgi:PncC family amidohydrolase